MSILSLLSSSNFIAVNKTAIKAVGLEAAVILGELASEAHYFEQQGQLNDDGYFYATADSLEEKTSLSRFRQNQAVEKLQGLGLISVKLMGVPCKRYVKINEKQVFELFQNQFSKNFKTGCQKISKLDVKKFDGNKNIGNKNKDENIENSNTFALFDLPEANQPAPAAAKATKKEQPEKITFGYETDAKLHGITAETLEYWKQQCPAVDVDQELKNAEMWLDGNRSKRKHNIKAFLSRWLIKAQESANRPAVSAGFSGGNSQYRQPKSNAIHAFADGQFSTIAEPPNTPNNGIKDDVPF